MNFKKILPYELFTNSDFPQKQKSQQYLEDLFEKIFNLLFKRSKICLIKKKKWSNHIPITFPFKTKNYQPL